MNNIKKIMLVVMLITIVFPGISRAENKSFELNVNSTEVEGRVDTQLRLFEPPPDIGIGFIYSDNNYMISNINFALKDEIFLPALSLGLGFKGSVGKAEINSKDFDIAALSLQFLGEYDLRKDTSELPISASVSLSIAPDPLSFKDTNRYVEFTFTIYGYIVNNAAIVVGYRDIEALFDDAKKSDDALFIGIKLLF